MINDKFWKNRRVFITGHTGFKGAWLSQWLKIMGADVTGFALEPITRPNLFNILHLEKKMESQIGNICNFDLLSEAINSAKPEVIFHLAAQALVHEAYDDPIGTLKTNIIGTANLLEAARNCDSAKVLINVTSDKCYQNDELAVPFVESDKMGGNDIYSCSKGCSELVTDAYRKSFYQKSTLMIATARAGNVIGGGDWSKNRLVPDIVKAFSLNQSVSIRNPLSIRPWQHVLEPLSGYLLLAETMWEKGRTFEGPWNFGPGESGEITVEKMTETMANIWENGASWEISANPFPPESSFLKLDCSKARIQLNWKPTLSIEDTIKWTMEWYKNMYLNNDMEEFTINQILRYMERGK